MLKKTLIYTYLLFAISQIAFSHSITLKKAEQIAISRSSEIKGLLAQSYALEEKAIANSQLVDPKFNLAFANIPTNSFSLSQEPMTQIQLGVEQAFPKGNSLKYKYLGTRHNAAAKKSETSIMNIQIRQKVRTAWLNLAYWLNVQTILYKEQRVFDNLVNVTRSMLANNKTQQKDVIRAELEFLEVKNKLINVKQNIRVAKTKLARWIGSKNAKNIRPTYLPTWQLKSSNIINTLKYHPILKADVAIIKAKKDDVKLQKEQFKPGFSLGGGYGFRQGNNVNGTKRADFIQIKLGVSLALFPLNRQSRQLKSSQLGVVSQNELRVSHLRELKEMLYKNLDVFKLKQQSANLYESSLVPDAKQYASATLSSYENTKTDFPTLARAYIKQFNTELGFITTLRERSQARINLLYIQGR